MGDRHYTATDLAVIQHRLAAIPGEMGAALTRMAFSPNIKERRDFSCALFDGEGRLLAQAAHIPVHLGAMPRSVEAVLETLPTLEPGDVALLNDPFCGGSHLPDITTVSPLFGGGADRPVGYAATRAHHADVGGMTPGSLPDSRSIFQEGLRIPPVWIRKGGEIVDDVLRLICLNSRSPEERRGDLRAQLRAHHIGEARWNAWVEGHGVEEARARMHALDRYAARRMAAVLERFPPGEWTAAEAIEGGTPGEEDTWIRGRLQVEAGRMRFDFSGSDDAMPGSLNTVHAVVESAVHYVLLCRLSQASPDGLPPVCAGCFEGVEVTTRPGSVLDAGPPHAVAGGNVETSQRVVDTVLELLAAACPGEIPAQSQGTMNNVTMGGRLPGGKAGFAYYETLGGGAGAGPGHPGAHGIQVHMTNTLNTPAEALEFAFPLRIRRLAILEGSGGAGAFPGGDGLVREWVAETEIEISLLTQRRRGGPRGREGGGDGRPGRQWIERRDGTREALTGRGHWILQPEDVLVVETPGGGGYGRP